MEDIREELGKIKAEWGHNDFIRWGIGGLVCIAYQEATEGNGRAAEYIMEYIPQKAYIKYLGYLVALIAEYRRVIFPKKLDEIWDTWHQEFILDSFGSLKSLAWNMRTDPKSRRLFAECIKAESTELLDLWRPADRLIEIWDGSTQIKYRIRKLTSKETWRLMGFTDEDYFKAKSVNSNTQLYRQSGNSIVTTCLMALFSQLHIEGCPVWNEISTEERNRLVDRTRKDYTPDIPYGEYDDEEEEEEMERAEELEEDEW